jgi:anti-sigma factor RsiW
MSATGNSGKQCAAMENKLVEYLDGRATPSDRHAVEAHLASCASCSLRADEFRALSSVLDDLPEIAPSPSFDAALRARIAAEPARRGFWEWLPSPRLAFAATALLVMAVWFSSGPRSVPVTAIANHAVETVQGNKLSADSEFGMIRDLPELENFDVISKFDALSELPGAARPSVVEGTKETR